MAKAHQLQMLAHWYFTDKRVLNEQQLVTKFEGKQDNSSLN